MTLNLFLKAACLILLALATFNVSGRINTLAAGALCGVLAVWVA